MIEMCAAGTHSRAANTRNSRGHWVCRPCEIERKATPEVRARIHAWQRAQQEKTKGNAVNSWKPWTPEDDRFLLQLREARVTQPEIAELMGRTFSAVRKRVGQLC